MKKYFIIAVIVAVLLIVFYFTAKSKAIKGNTGVAKVSIKGNTGVATVSKEYCMNNKIQPYCITTPCEAYYPKGCEKYNLR